MQDNWQFNVNKLDYLRNNIYSLITDSEKCCLTGFHSSVGLVWVNLQLERV